MHRSAVCGKFVTQAMRSPEMGMSDRRDGFSRVQTTHHCRLRQQQRGKRSAAIDLLFARHDIELRTRNGCRAVQLSKWIVDELKADGYSPQLIDAARLSTMVLSDTDAVVTVYRAPEVRSLRKRGLARVLRRLN